mmetsp:Transcript_26775/g.58368  ORF Transcript_26775/g.58368 Transcript_26775/m.58368 type:complete len:190 (-) Transcript_26775:187-756(-)
MKLLVTRRDGFGAAELHRACRYGRAEDGHVVTVKWICGLGTLIPQSMLPLLLAETRNWWLALHSACHAGHEEAAALHLEALLRHLTREEVQLFVFKLKNKYFRRSRGNELLVRVLGCTLMYRLKNEYFKSRRCNEVLEAVCGALSLQPLLEPRDDDEKARRGRGVLELLCCKMRELCARAASRLTGHHL